MLVLMGPGTSQESQEPLKQALVMEDWEQLATLGRYREALTRLPDEHFARGELLYWLGDPQAEELLRNHLPESQLALARWCWQVDRYQEARQFVEGRMELEGRLTALLVGLCEGQEGWAEAEQVCSLMAGHRAWRGWQDLAVTAQFRQNGKLARESFQRALEGWRSVRTDHPEAATCLFGLAGVLEELDSRSPEMSETVETFFAISDPSDPRRVPMASALASHCESLGRLSWFETKLKQWVSPGLEKLLAQTLFLQGKLEEALAPLERALKDTQNPQNPQEQAHCHWLQGRILRALGRAGWEICFSEAGRLVEPGTPLASWIDRDSTGKRL